MKGQSTFGSVPLNEHKSDTIESCNAHFSCIEKAVNDLPPSRLSAIALTKLEEASMWVNKAIARSE